jgi:hypothetical protein
MLNFRCGHEYVEPGGQSVNDAEPISETFQNR